jgi:hypothetical protein
MTIERPMFPPRAESVHAFPAQASSDRRPDETLTSDSPMPAESPTAAIVDFPGQHKEPPAKQRSALLGLRDSGLELVSRQKTPKNQQATQEDYARIKFRAVKRDERVMNALGEGWHQHGISARSAYATMIMSRERWIEFHAETDMSHVDELLASFIDTAEFLKSVVDRVRSNAADRYRLRGAGARHLRGRQAACQISRFPHEAHIGFKSEIAMKRRRRSHRKRNRQRLWTHRRRLQR